MMMFSALVRRNISSLYVSDKKSYNYYCNVCYFSTIKEKPKQQTITVSEFLIHKHNFSPEVASHIASVVSVLKNPENSDSVLSFLKDAGFTKSQLEKTFKYRPALLNASLDDIIKPKIITLRDFGFSSNDIAFMIAKEPGILHTSLQKKLVPGLSLLKGLFGGSTAEVAKAVRNSGTGWLLTADLEKTLMPNVEFLISNCGVTMKQIATFLNHQPRFLLYKPEQVRKYVENAVERGFDQKSRMFIYAVCVVGRMTTRSWDNKLEVLGNILESSEDDILRLVRKNPQVFNVSEDKMKKVKQVVLATGKYDASCIAKFPYSVMFSIEKRLKPRFQVLEILESRHLIASWPILTTVCKMPNQKFFEEFVRPYSDEVGDLFEQIMITSFKG